MEVFFDYLILHWQVTGAIVLALLIFLAVASYPDDPFDGCV